MERYQHTQIGYLMIAALGIVLLFVAGYMVVDGFNRTAFAMLIVLGICLILFATLTVTIEDDAVEIRFGPGVIRKRFSLADIESCRVVKNPWYVGWGIRLTSDGWLYNVSGFHAVQICMKTGRKYRIGTDVPNDLENALRQSLVDDSSTSQEDRR